MKYTLQTARSNQDEAKRKADDATDATTRRNHMNDVMFWTGYIAAMIDWDYPPLITNNSVKSNDVVFKPDQLISMSGDEIINAPKFT